jgi:hypothetical protein
VALELLLALILMFAVVAVVAAPLGGSGAVEPAESGELAGLEAAKQAKYREIREAELDFRAGKLSEPDYRALDRTLRAEAIELLRQIDVLRQRLVSDELEHREKHQQHGQQTAQR